MTGTVGRYAPSPTGPLHLGNLRTALLCWLHARADGGRLLVRMDDLDTPRNRPGAAEGILEDLRWLGLDWDGEVAVQSTRGDRYGDAFERLKAAGRAFPCRCSRRDIEMAPSVPDPRFPAPRYPGTCRPENRPAAFSPDEPVAWRFRVADETLEFPDGILGPQRVNLAAYPGDFVIRRKDGIFAYQLASVVDDGLLGVTDVVRGADLADSTARQIALFRSLGYPCSPVLARAADDGCRGKEAVQAGRCGFPGQPARPGEVPRGDHRDAGLVPGSLPGRGPAGRPWSAPRTSAGLSAAPCRARLSRRQSPGFRTARRSSRRSLRGP